MEVQPLSCNNCGAPLDIPSTANFATCSYCKARLAIKRNESTAYTEVLNQIGENTGQMAEDLRYMRLRQQLQHLDEQWQGQNQQFLERQGNLQAQMVSAQKGSKMSGAMLMLIIGLFILCGSLSFRSPIGGLVIGLFIVILGTLGIAGAVKMRRKFSSLLAQSNELRQVHNEAEHGYQSQRTGIMPQLNSSSHNAAG